MLRRLLVLGLDALSTGLDALSARLDGAPRWCLHITDGGDHFYPLQDAVEHAADEECVCGPTVTRTVCDEHGDTWRYRHHPLTQPDTQEDA